MTIGLRGDPAWGVFGPSQSSDDRTTKAEAEVYAVALSKQVANDTAYELVPYVGRDVSLVVVEGTLVDD